MVDDPRWLSMSKLKFISISKNISSFNEINNDYNEKSK